jgi:hypothetical protein
MGFDYSKHSLSQFYYISFVDAVDTLLAGLAVSSQANEWAFLEISQVFRLGIKRGSQEILHRAHLSLDSNL